MTIPAPTWPISTADLVQYIGGYVGHSAMTFPFTKPGALTTGVGTARFRVPVDCTIVSVALAVGTAPTGAAVIADLNRNGTTVFTTQANRPQVAAAATSGSAATPAVVALAAGDLLTVDIDQVGSTVAGADLTMVVYVST